MLTGTIGANAGLVWDALQTGAQSTKAVKKVTKLKEADLNMALGWLARENKVAFSQVDGEMFINLI